MKIISWNTNHWQNKNQNNGFWEYLDNFIDPDIALLQEIKPKKEVPGFIGDKNKPVEKISDAETYIWEDIDPKRKWGTGIFTKNLPVRELKIKTDYQGSIAVAEIPYNEELYTFISLYAILENGYSITTLHRMFSDLTPILDGKMDSWGNRRKVILGGDFNASLQWDEQQPGESHKIMFERLENFGMVDLIRERYNEPVQTWRSKNAKRRWQLDYVFVSNNIVDKVNEIKVLYDQQIEQLSDHNPIEVILE